MLIDTHCHINIMVKESFESPLSESDFQLAHKIIAAAAESGVGRIFNVGTSIVESINCIELAKRFENNYAAIAIHPNDLSPEYKDDIAQLKNLVTQHEKIIAIGECGLDYHYPDYDKQKQQDAFKAQIELALEHNLSLIIHTRDAGDDTLRCLEIFKDPKLRGTIHCFSENLAFAQEAIALGFVLGIGGTITYRKNQYLRDVVTTLGLDHIILETDAPYLSPQIVRGKQNNPANIALIAQFIAELMNIPVTTVAQKTTANVAAIFAPAFSLNDN